jgi:hypothetical protein
MGVGQAMLSHALALAGGSATLKCQVGNSRAIRFYERGGWIQGERGESDYGPWVRMHSPERAAEDRFREQY